jgi:hypothetical protein
MGRKDTYHGAVRRALEQDGWTITHDPLMLAFGTTDLYVDLGAEAPLGAEKAGRRIAVEVKSFLGVSQVTDLERALGQWFLYEFLLQEQEPERTLFLALPDRAYESLFENIPAGRRLVAERRLRLLVYDPEAERTVRWIEPITEI